MSDDKALSYLAETSGGALLLAPRFRSRKQIKYKYRVKSSPFLTHSPAMVESHAGEKSLPNAHTKEHQVGVPFRGNSGRWFVRRQSDGRVVPAKAPGGQTASPKTTPAQPEEHGDTPASKQPETTTSKKPAASKPMTKKPAAPKPVPKPKKEKITPENAKQKIAEYVAKGNLTPEDSRDFAQYLLGLTVVQLKGLEKELGIKGKGRKAEQAARIAERALQGVKTPEKPAEKPVQPEGKPKEESTGNWAEDVIRKLSAIPPARSSRDVSAFNEAGKIARQLQADPDGASKLRELGLPPVTDPATVAEYLMAKAKQDEISAKYVQDKAAKEFVKQAFSRPGGARVDVTQPKFASKQEAVTSVKDQVNSGLKKSDVAWTKAGSYAASVDTVMRRLPDVAARRAAHHLKSFRFAARQDQVGRLAYGAILEATKSPGQERDLLVSDYKAHLEGSGKDVAQWESRVKNPATERAAMDEARAWCWSRIEPFLGDIGGGFSGSGGMYLDGGIDRTSHAGPGQFAMTTGNSQVGLYAHEMTHAIDGPGHEYSSSPLWQHAWNEEINRGEQPDQTLTTYASTVDFEGFAEFGRLLYGGNVNPKEVEQRFPKCSQFFKDNGLWPTSK